MDVLEFFHAFKTNAIRRRLIVLVNLAGIAYGFYYYTPQFDVTPIALWLFVPDSPLAVLWATVPLLLYEFGRRRSDTLDAVAVVANVQVGLWTAYVLLYYSDHFQTFDFGLNALLLFAHLGMAVEALIFLRDLRASLSRAWAKSLPVLAGVGAWFLLNDWLDYFYTGINNGGCAGLRPYTVPCYDLGVTAAFTITLSLTIVAALAYLVRPRRGPLTRSVSPDVESRADR